MRYGDCMDGQFETIVSVIREGFQPQHVTNEAEAENELFHFLHSRFPNKIHARGHTSTGTRIDVVIDGTYAIELIAVNDEARLVSCLHQMLASKEDFPNLAVIIITSDTVPAEKLNTYIEAYAKVGVKTIVKHIRSR